MIDGETQPTGDVEGEADAALEVAPREQDNGLPLLGWGCLVVMSGLIGVGAFAALQPHYVQSNIHVTESSAQLLRHAIILFRAEHPDAHRNTCPSARLLIEEQYVDSRFRGEDSWDRPFRTVCDESSVQVYSAGPDGTFNTADDVNR